MGRNGGWFTAVKKALYLESRKDLKTQKSKKKWFGKHTDHEQVPSPEETTLDSALLNIPPPPPPPPPCMNDVKLIEAEKDQNDHAYSIALAGAVAAKAAAAAAQAAEEVVRLTRAMRFSGKTKEEIAAIKIQTAFRGYVSRKALRALKGLERLKVLIQGQSVKRQAATTLQCMQTLARVQSQVRARRIRMSEENQALQRQLQQKRDKELGKLGTSISAEDWNVSTQSKEQLKAKQQNRQKAAMRRERALAYAFSHQQTWKNSPKSSEKQTSETSMDPNNPHWGWSWLERWMAARPWENQSVTETVDGVSTKSRMTRSRSVGASGTQTRKLQTTGKTKSLSSKASTFSVGDIDSASTSSPKSDRYRRHSIAGPPVRDDESIVSSPCSASRAAKSRSCFPSPLGVGPRKSLTPVAEKKRLSLSVPPPSDRRLSGPAKVESAPKRNTKASNGGR